MKAIIIPCNECGGTGSRTGETNSPSGPVPFDVPCQRCAGDGSLLCGYLSDDLVDKLNSIMNKCNDIFEKLNE